jgi:hypothetical protein
MEYSTLHLTPHSFSLVPDSFRGVPHSCANGVGHSGMSGNQGGWIFPLGGWDGGLHTDVSDNRRGIGG